MDTKILLGLWGSRVASTALRQFPSGYTSFSENALQGPGYSATGFKTYNVYLFHYSGLQSMPLLQAGNKQQHCAARTAATALHICKSCTGMACVSHGSFLHNCAFLMCPDVQFSTYGLK